MLSACCLQVRLGSRNGRALLPRSLLRTVASEGLAASEHGGSIAPSCTEVSPGLLKSHPGRRCGVAYTLPEPDQSSLPRAGARLPLLQRFKRFPVD